MYDIRQFRPILYSLLLVGLTGFALAAELPIIWLIAVAFVLLNAWLVAIKRFRPMSRLIANLITLGAVAYVVRELLISPATPVIIIGEFLVFLQLVKLWEQRANRDYAQLLILSLLLMVSASMNTASLAFAVLMIAYLLLSLYCCLLFHLKVETDAARAAMPVPEDKLSPGTLRQDQRYLSRSMRRLTGLVSAVSLACAVVVFLFFPRGNGAGIFGPLQPFHPPVVLTGFSDQVDFGDLAKITQSSQTIAFVKLWHNDQIVAPSTTIYLRGLTLDRYHKPERPGEPWGWGRSVDSRAAVSAFPTRPFVLTPNGNDRWRAQIALWPTHTDVLFSLPGLTEFTPRRPVQVRYSPDDEALQLMSPINERFDYEILATGELGPPRRPSPDRIPGATIRQLYPRIYEFARRPEVSGVNANGSLADQRILAGDTSPNDEQIAANIESYFRSHFRYTLDLTDEKALQGRDPMVAFLYDWKKGHCEYFAGAMTLMCQSLGMETRMVIGFRVDPEDFNTINDTYAVHESDAHAWVEVRTPHGWKTYDPTSSQLAQTTAGNSLLTRARHLIEYLEYTYANAVIAYDAQNRKSVIASVETGLATAAATGSDAMKDLDDFIQNSAAFWNASTWILTILFLIMILILAAVLGWFVWERWRLRRRAHRIGIESLPESEQIRLARQLGFYDELLRLLDQHRIARPRHFTPLEFSRSLTFLPVDAYDTIHRLTELFYKVRYGGVELPPPRRRRLLNVLAKLSHDFQRLHAGATP